MATGSINVSSALLLAVSLAAASVWVWGRATGAPLLRNDGAVISEPLSRIFDTSKYGIRQLNNGLAQTPQMGSALSLCPETFSWENPGFSTLVPSCLQVLGCYQV